MAEERAGRPEADGGAAAQADGAAAARAPALAGAEPALREAAEAALPALRALAADPGSGLLPQQALGALGLVADVLNRLLAHLTDPEALAKFGRLKLSALRKRAPRRPELVEAVLRSAGFGDAADGGEHVEWAAEGAALPLALAVLALVARVQEHAQASGLRGLEGCLGPGAGVGVPDVLALTYGGARLLEPRRGGPAGPRQTAESIGAPLVRRAWLAERLPALAAALEEGHVPLEPGARERALARAVARAASEARAAAGLRALRSSPQLGETAQVCAGVALAGLRQPGLLGGGPGAPIELRSQPYAPTRTAEAAGSGQPAGALTPLLLGCIPAFRLGLPHAALSEIVRMREVPAFFTAGVHEKPFEVSLAALSEGILCVWRDDPTAAEALLHPEVSTAGFGCALDISDDDKAVVFAVLA